MKCTPTKVLTNKINEMFKKLENGYSAYKIEMPENIFKCSVDYNAMDHLNDQDWDKGTFNVIAIEYPDNYYAMPRYLTTNDLQRILRNSDRTLDGFLNALLNAVEI